MPDFLEVIQNGKGLEDAEAILRYAVETFGDGLKLACSMGVEDAVLVSMLAKMGAKTKVFVLDTGRLHPETYQTLSKLRIRYDLPFEIYFPQTEAIQKLVSEKGPFSFYDSIENRKECCGIRKVEPLRRALSDATAWITGLRREQSVTRADLPIMEIDPDHGNIVKINPLAGWTTEQVWAYAEANNVPVNPLHKQGFPSIGCEPCTRAIEPGEDIRAGRWWWESPDLKECGLHLKVVGNPK